MTDPFTAAKRGVEDRDRIQLLAEDARARLQKFTDWPECSHEDAVSELLDIMSWPDALAVLSYIDWEDNRADGDSDP